MSRRRDDQVPPSNEETTQEPPMLILGERAPEVEDTTPEQLARRAAELEQQRLEAEQEVERLRQQTEKELRSRQEAIDKAERELRFTEQRLRRTARQVGQEHTVPRVRLQKKSASSRPPVHPLRSRGGLVATGAAVLLALLTGIFAGTAASDDDSLRTVAEASETRSLWLTAAMMLDEELLAHLAGEQVTDEEGSPPSAAVVRQARDGFQPRYPYSLRSWEEDAALIFADTSTAKVRAVNTWSDLRSMSSAAISQTDVRRAAEGTEGRGGLAITLALGAAVALVLLLVLTRRSGEYWAMALFATCLALVGVIAWMGQDPQRDTVETALARHLDNLDQQSQVQSQQGRDLEHVLGTRQYSYLTPERFWTEDGHILYQDDSVEAAAYRTSRQDVGALVLDPETAEQAGAPQSGEEELLAASRALAEAGRAAFDARTAEVTASSTELASLGGTGSGTHPMLPRGLGLLTALLIAIGAMMPTLRGSTDEKQEKT